MRVVLALCLLCLASSAGAAKFEVYGNHANMDNDGTCSVPETTALAAGTPLVFHVRWSGPVAGEDSLSGVSDGAFSFIRKVPRGQYSITYWWSTDAPGCQTTVSFTVRNRPWWRALGIR